MRYPINGMEIICKQKVNFIDNFKIIDIKLLYELIKNETIIESEIQDFPMKLYSDKFLIEILIDVGFNSVEVVKSSKTDKHFSIIKCIK